MKIVIAGSRTIDNMAELEYAISCFIHGQEITEVVSGSAVGADLTGEFWAIQKGIPVNRFPADWTKYGKAAGIIRNRTMAEYADGAIILWDGKSPGSLNMIQNIRRLKKPFFVNVVSNLGDRR